ncbi:unnamed protein product [Linum trigynum]|uniref:Secreted protein n=1 Tax=Linum trigynum TaxID=586398 RepID=A0AAV2ERV2_9ROSI
MRRSSSSFLPAALGSLSSRIWRPGNRRALARTWDRDRLSGRREEESDFPPRQTLCAVISVVWEAATELSSSKQFKPPPGLMFPFSLRKRRRDSPTPTVTATTELSPSFTSGLRSRRKQCSGKLCFGVEGRSAGVAR